MSKSKEILKEVEKLTTELNEARKVYMEKIKGMFHSIAKELFNQYPRLESVTWTQYTPYFNDGEECTFSTNSGWPDLEFNDEPMIENNEDIEEVVKAFLTAFDDDVYRELFDDHVEVILSRSGIEVKDYDHD